MKLVLPDAELLLLPKFFSSNEADLYLEVLRAKVTWTQEQIKLYGKTYDVPRLTAWYGDVGKIYTYSGIRTVAMPWTAPLLEIKSAIEQASLAPFNSVLLNYYRSGLDGVSWHSDDEPELGKNPIIASVSFGEERPFQMKHKGNKSLKYSFVLPHGSLLIMQGGTQTYWLHQIPKSSRNMGPRVNLTFRSVLS